ncbi:MAG: prenyltransferase/squalene oxidase repeat-containing protein [Gammaproteobacteria bacterium]
MIHLQHSRQARIVAAALLTVFATSASAEGLDPELGPEVRRAVDEGLSYLRDAQADDGSWSSSVGVTAIALRAFLESHRGYDESDGAFITRPVQFLLANVNPDGSITDDDEVGNYSTSVSIIALEATGNPAYDEIIANAQAYLSDVITDEDDLQRDDPYYGGIGYNAAERPDLSNQYMTMEALRASSLDPDDPAWERALIFVSRTQNRSESNDQPWAVNDGGFTYMPGYSPHGGTGSYGSMTHAGLISLLSAGLDKHDPRIEAAYDWITANYTLDDNPGAPNGEGLYYYYLTFAKSMSAYGADNITDSNGNVHNWRNDLASKLLELQDKDGSWVNERSARWWEDDRNLITARSVIALNLASR